MGAKEMLEVLAGLLLRLLLPLGLTLLVAAVLKRFDDRWRAQSLGEDLALHAPVQQVKCWEAFNCSPERRAVCKAYQNPDRPCWENFRVNGLLQTACSRCPLRKLKMAAPVPAGS